LRNPPFKKVFLGKSDLGQGRPPNEDRGVLRNPPYKRGFWGNSDLGQGHRPDEDRGWLTTHPSKVHSRGSLISDWDVPLMRTGGA